MYELRGKVLGHRTHAQLPAISPVVGQAERDQKMITDKDAKKFYDSPKTREQFEKAMQAEEKRSTKPCASCFHRPDCTDEWNCGILRQWRIKYMKDTST